MTIIINLATNTDSSNWGELLAINRMRAGVSPSQLAQKIGGGTKAAKICRYEREGKNPRFAIQALLALGYGPLAILNATKTGDPFSLMEINICHPIGPQARAFREKAGISAAEVARLTDNAPSYISQFELGSKQHKSGSIMMLFWYARACGADQIAFTL